MINAHWSLNLGRFRGQLEAAVREKAESVAQEFVNRCIKESPVYRGHFRASWNVSQGNPRYIRATGGSPTAPLPPPIIVVKATKDFPTFYVTNGQPYARKLEDGSSTQAPNGIVATVLASMR